MHLNPLIQVQYIINVYFPFNSTIKHKKQLKYISPIFLVFLLTLFLCHLYFLCYLLYEGLFHLLPLQPLIPGRGSTYQHTGST